MIKEAIEKIEQMTKPWIFPEMADGRIYSSKGLSPVYGPSPVALGLQTLTGLRDYLKENVDTLEAGGLILHVISPERVELISRLLKPWETRDTLIVVKNDSLKFPFGHFMDVEDFIIKMQSMFVQDEQTALILKVVGNVTDGTVTGFRDDGVSQQVTAKAGVSRVENIPVPNPVTLAPFRTFLEIEQPASKFVFRMRSGEGSPVCALFEADGGAWKGAAVLEIKEWLLSNTKGIAIIA